MEWRNSCVNAEKPENDAPVWLEDQTHNLIKLHVRMLVVRN